MTDLQSRVVVIAEDVLARAGVAALIESEGWHQVVGQISPHPTWLDDLDLLAPDVVVYDVGWSSQIELSPLSALCDQELPLVVLLGANDHASQVLATLNAATHYAMLPRRIGSYQLSHAIQTVRQGLIVFAPDFAHLIVQTNQPSLMPDMPITPLTKREQEVLYYLAQGLTNKAIAQALDITEHTVKFHVNAIMGKTQAQSRTEAVIRATRAGLILL